MSRPIPEHGNPNRYASGCRCTPCTKAASRADAERRLDRMAGRPRQIPAGPAADHARALMARGLSAAQIGHAARWDPSSIRRLVAGQKEILAANAAKVLSVPLNVRVSTGDVPALGATRRIRALYALGHLKWVIARESGISEDSVGWLAAGAWSTLGVAADSRIRAAYDRLSMETGTSWKTRRKAERNGWVPPLAWDDDSIDNPEARPIVDQAVNGSSVEGEQHVDQVAVDAYLKGRSVDVTDAERLAALLAVPGRGMSMLDVDKAQGLPAKTSENFLRRMTKRYERAGCSLPAVGAEVVVLPPMKRTAAQMQDQMGEAA